MAELEARDAKLIQYLNEAYGKEKELETALQAHIAMTTRDAYKKRLKDHLRETKTQAKGLQRRIKQLGGKAELVPAPGPDIVGKAAGAGVSAANKAAAAAKGPLHALRGTSEPETMLKNAKTEYWNEAEEIANYKAIETLAEAVGDKDTAKLAREYRRQEERMASIPRQDDRLAHQGGGANGDPRLTAQAQQGEVATPEAATPLAVGVYDLGVAVHRALHRCGVAGR